MNELITVEEEIWTQDRQAAEMEIIRNFIFCTPYQIVHG
jgi:hypothetical protein